MLIYKYFNRKTMKFEYETLFIFDTIQVWHQYYVVSNEELFCYRNKKISELIYGISGRMTRYYLFKMLFNSRVKIYESIMTV